ncbi:TPA: hypothetical protein ACWP27_000950, partial [Escherichia coli]
SETLRCRSKHSRQFRAESRSWDLSLMVKTAVLKVGYNPMGKPAVLKVGYNPMGKPASSYLS